MEPEPPIAVLLQSSRRSVQAVAIGGVVAAGGAVLVLAPLLSGAATGSVVGGLVVGGVLLALGALILGGWWLSRSVALVIGPDGIGWDSPRKPWWLPWEEVSRAAVRVGYHPGNGPLLVAKKSWRVHVELVLVDEACARRHPEMMHLQQRTLGGAPDRYGVPLASRRELIGPTDEALQAFAGERYEAVIDDGRLPPGNGYAPDEF